MKEYPFELWIYAQLSQGGTDTDGFPISGTFDWVKHCNCYEQVLGESKEYKQANGSSFYYSSKVFLPENTEPIPTGTKIQVRNNKHVRLNGEAKRFSIDLEHCRLWV